MCDVLELSPGEKYTVDNAQSAQGLDNNMQSVLEIKQVMMIDDDIDDDDDVDYDDDDDVNVHDDDQVSHTDWGVYTCRANNSMGEGEAMVVVKSKINHIFKRLQTRQFLMV